MPRTLLFLLPEQFQGENQGLYIQHVASMEWLLAGSGWRLETATLQHPDLETVALAADLVVIHMLPNREAEGVIRMRRAARRPTLFEISDNFLDLGPWVAANHALRNPLVRQYILYHAWLCDGLQVYAPALAELFRSVNGEIAVFDPYVPLAEPKAVSSHGRLIVGWAGTSSHADDLRRIAPALIDFVQRHPDTMLAYMGDPTLFRSCFGRMDPARTDVRGFGSYEAYLEFVRSWDLGLAPLAPSGFNNARTDTKFATYAACGVAALLERHPVHEPHRGRALLFEDGEDLGLHLERLHGDRARIRELGTRARRWARRERGAERLRKQRIGFFESLLPAPGEESGEALEVPSLEEALAASPVRRLRAGHRSWSSRIDYFRALLEHQPYDYIALMNLIDLERRSGAGDDRLAPLYGRLSLLAPEAVPGPCRPAQLHRFLPDAA